MNQHVKSTEENVATEWDGNAEAWARNLADQLDLINEGFGIPAFLDFLGNLAGLTLLDAGCGEGRSARHLADGGAKVTGIDISPAMLAHAQLRENRAPQGINYQVASSADLPFADRSFDRVTSLMALMDTPDLAGSLREFARVLKPGGEVAIMVRHPCFFTTGYTILRNRTALTVAGYFRVKPYLERCHLQASGTAPGESFSVTRYPHTLSDYLNGLLVNGLTVTGIREPRPTEELCQNQPLLRFWQRHAALYLLLRGRKAPARNDSQD